MIPPTALAAPSSSNSPLSTYNSSIRILSVCVLRSRVLFLCGGFGSVVLDVCGGRLEAQRIHICLILLQESLRAFRKVFGRGVG